MIGPNQTNPLWEFTPWQKKGQDAQIKNPAALQKERCFSLLGRRIACVQDEAEFKITPAMIGIAVVLVLLVRR